MSDTLVMKVLMEGVEFFFLGGRKIPVVHCPWKNINYLRSVQKAYCQ